MDDNLVKTAVHLDLFQNLERSLESAVANITAVNVRVKLQEDRLSAVEKSNFVDAEVDYKTGMRASLLA